jgi:aminopeptidase N
MREGQAEVTRREDYQVPGFWIDTVHLVFDLDTTKTRVLNTMTLRRNPQASPQALRLDGEELNLSRVLLNGQGTSFKIDNHQLVLENIPEGDEPFKLEVFTTCNPSKNTQLSGLYLSQNSLFTQCEAQGFRRITYFLDRPDVMASFSVTLRADPVLFPVLLSNGNLAEHGKLDDGRHFAHWVDPHKKPSYLFALVAGQLVCREQKIVSRSGQEHLLQIFVRSGDLDKTDHAMNALMASVAWDEHRFGLALDLERFMIVATSDFNMGAMENKGLNIFNTKYVLASQATATDQDFANIESVIGHEYFHNWSGNRVTCRDWFQLSLKEGLTVFRDQEFSQDLATSASARAVKRIEDVRLLRTVQFAEDAGPMAHPVRPDTYMEINNFYTVTVYEKGAEVVRMMQTLVGRDGFAKGLTLYFQRHDGQAVTCDDFAQAIADANPDSALTAHLIQFKRWYSQAGTPRLDVHGEYDAQAHRYTMHFKQSCSPTSGQLVKQPLVIPVEMGLLGPTGTILLDHQRVVLTEEVQSLVIEGISEQPIPSLLRGFSAPVQLHYPYEDEHLLVLLAHDTDAFNRWEVAQRLFLNNLLRSLSDDTLNARPLPDTLVAGLRSLLRDEKLDAAFKELVLTLPSETYVAEQCTVVDPQRIHTAREIMRCQLASDLGEDWAWAYAHCGAEGTYQTDAKAAGARALKGLALNYLCLQEKQQGNSTWANQAYKDFMQADNMTDRIHALSALVYHHLPQATDALSHCYKLFKQDDLVIDKWFALQASAPDQDGTVLAKVKQLMLHADFHIRNPNRARSLLSAYCANPSAFHRNDAAGYVFWSERVLELDAFNPQVAARLARALDRWRKLSPVYQSAAQEALRRVAAKSDLSADVREVISSALQEE